MMALAALNVAEAKKVKFQVDMTGKTISPNGLHIAGNFQAAAGVPAGDWQPGATTLTNGGSGNIYSVIVDIPAKKVYEFKFINDNNWGSGEESVPAISQVGSVANGGTNGNRWIYIDSLKNDTTVLPPIMFGGAAPKGKTALRFAVDLQKETSVSADGVYIAGNFQGANGASADWKPNETRMSKITPSQVVNKVYEYIAYVDTTAGVEWKYLNGNDWPYSENVPSGCQKGGGNQNRFYQATSASWIAPKVCFGSCSACPTAPIPKYKLMFQVDMSNEDCLPYDSVTIAGAGARLTAFGAGLKMAPVGSTKIFALLVDSLDSGEVTFKFRAHRNGNTGWEGGGDNRIFTLTKNDTLPLTCFSSRVVGACPSKPAPSTITFKVDVTDTIPGVLFVMGTFKTPNWQAGAIRMTPVPGSPGVFQTVVNNVCPGSFNYKFVNAYNGDSSDTKWEETFKGVTDSSCIEPSGLPGGFNRKYTRTSTSPVTLYYKLNKCNPGSNVGINEVALSAGFKLYPNPAELYTMVEFNDKAASHDIVVMDIAGKVIQSYTNYKQNTLLINTDDMSKGIYFIKASNTRNESVTSKLIVR